MTSTAEQQPQQQEEEEEEQHFLRAFDAPRYVGVARRDRTFAFASAPMVDRVLLPILRGDSDVSVDMPTNLPKPQNQSQSQNVVGKDIDRSLSKEVERKNAIMALFWPHIQQHVMELRPHAEGLGDKIKYSQVGHVYLAAGTCEEKTRNMEAYVRSLGFDLRGVENARRFFKRIVAANADETSILCHPRRTRIDAFGSGNPLTWDWSCFLAEKLHARCCAVACKICADGRNVADGVLIPPYDAIVGAFAVPAKNLADYYECCPCPAISGTVNAGYARGVKIYPTAASKHTIYGDGLPGHPRNTLFDIFPLTGELFDGASYRQRRLLDETRQQSSSGPRFGTVVQHADILAKIVANLTYLERQSDVDTGFFTVNDGHSFSGCGVGVLKIALDAWCWGFHNEKRCGGGDAVKTAAFPVAVLFDDTNFGVNRGDVSEFEKYFGRARCINATQLGILSKLSSFKFIKELYSDGARSRKAKKLLSHSSHMVRHYAGQAIRETYETTGKIICAQLQITAEQLGTVVISQWGEVAKILKKTCLAKRALLVQLVSQRESSWFRYTKNGKYDIEEMLKWLSKTSNLVMDPSLLESLLIAMETHKANTPNL